MATGSNTIDPAGTVASTIQETSGPTSLPIGAVADGQVLKRVGNTIVGAAGVSGADQLGLSPTAVKTSAYNAAAGELVPVDTTSGPVTVTLPTAPANGTVIAVKHVIQGGTNAVTVNCGGSDVYNKAAGATSATLPLASQAILIQYKSTGAIWYVVSDDLPLAQLDARFLAIAGNAATATKLAATKNIDGQAFDGSSDITVVAPGTHAATSKATPVDADELPLVDSAASNVLKKLTWANLKATLKTYLDTLYVSLATVLPGTELGYAQITSSVNITGTSSASANTVLTAPAITFDGAPVMVEVFSPNITCDTNAAGDVFRVRLFEGSTEIGMLAQIRSDVTTTNNITSFYGQYRFTPTAGSHTYAVKCSITGTTAGTPAFGAGAGGTDTLLPAFIRITKV